MFIFMVAPLLLDDALYKKEKVEENKTVNKKLSEVFDCRSEGLCESCDYGFDNCIRNGKPYCKQEEDNDEEGLV